MCTDIHILVLAVGPLTTLTFCYPNLNHHNITPYPNISLIQRLTLTLDLIPTLKQPFKEVMTGHNYLSSHKKKHLHYDGLKLKLVLSTMDIREKTPTHTAPRRSATFRYVSMAIQTGITLYALAFVRCPLVWCLCFLSLVKT